jgi:hypothetical protein
MENESRVSGLVQKRKRSFAVVAENFLEELINEQNNKKASLNQNQILSNEFLRCGNALKRKLQMCKTRPNSA